MKVCRFTLPDLRIIAGCRRRMFTCFQLRGYQCFELHPRSIERLLQKFPPRFSRIDAEHITFKYGVSCWEPLPDMPQKIEVLGYFCDDSLECVSVAVDGVLQRRDGNVYHITLSREPHRRAAESNDLIRGTVGKPCQGLFLSVVPVFRLIKLRK